MNKMIDKITIGTTNVYVAGAEKKVLIDTGMPKKSGVLLRRMQHANIDPQQLSLIVITHAHVDHVGGLEQLAKRFSIPVMMHKTAAEAYRNNHNPSLNPTCWLGRIFKKLIKPSTPLKPVPVLHQISEETSLVPFGIQAAVLPTPGHTSGSLSVVFPDCSAIIGDLLMGRPWASSLPMLPWFAEDLHDVCRSCEELLARGIDTFYPGHGGPFTAKKVEKLLQRRSCLS